VGAEDSGAALLAGGTLLSTPGSVGVLFACGTGARSASIALFGSTVRTCASAASGLNATPATASVHAPRRATRADTRLTIPIMPATPRLCRSSTIYQIIGSQAETTMNERRPESIPGWNESGSEVCKNFMA
jgi:hypothetical protein